MAVIKVGVGEMALSSDGGAQIVTYALGSCLGLAIHDPVAGVGGLLHLMLPDSNLDPALAARRPALFADTGVPRLFKEAYALGASKARIRVVLAGCSRVMDAGGHFNIGERNLAAVRRMFWRNNVLIDAQDTGGNVNRTLGLEVGNGRAWVKINSAAVHDI